MHMYNGNDSWQEIIESWYSFKTPYWTAKTYAVRQQIIRQFSTCSASAAAGPTTRLEIDPGVNPLWASGAECYAIVLSCHAIDGILCCPLCNLSINQLQPGRHSHEFQTTTDHGLENSEMEAVGADQGDSRCSTKGAQSFGDRTTIHGIADITNAGSHLAGVLWTGIFVGCVIAFALQAVTLTNQFQSEPIASYVQSEFPTNFPPILVCPDNYHYNLEKLKLRDAYELSPQTRTLVAEKYFGGNETMLDEKLNEATDQNGLEYGKILSLWFLKSMQHYGFLQNLLHKIMRSDSNRFFLQSLMGTIKEDVKQHFWNAFLRTNESVADAELDLAQDFKDVIRPYALLGLEFEWSYMLMSVHGACYGFKFDQVLVPLLSNAQYALFELTNNGWHDKSVTGAGSMMSGYVVYFSDLSFLPQNPYITLSYDEHHFVEISMTRVKRENLRRRPCRHWSQHHYAACSVDCFNRNYCNNPEIRKINGSRACTLWHPYITREEEHGKLCNWWDGEGSLAKEEETDEQFHCLGEKMLRTDDDVSQTCITQCPLVCSEIMYYPTIVRSTTNGHGYYYGTYISMKYHKPNSEFLIEERKEFTSVSFVSNLGGTLSLWIGASFLSLIQTSCYFTNKLVEKFNERR